MKIRTTVYLSEESAKLLKELAWSAHTSVSGYLEDHILKHNQHKPEVGQQHKQHKPEPVYVESYSDGIPKELPKEKKIEALKSILPKSDYFNPDPKKGKK